MSTTDIPLDQLLLRGAELAHIALDEVLKAEERRRSTFRDPLYPPDMSVLNNFLDSLDR